MACAGIPEPDLELLSDIRAEQCRWFELPFVLDCERVNCQ